MKKHFILASLLITTSLFAQKKTPENWMLLNPLSDKVYGAGIESAYQKLKDRKAKTVIVAIIDSGTDIEHEDLKDVIWTNEDEIPDNGIDDDKNGYIDDVHGWSFLGGKNGDINYEASELARIYKNMSKRFKTDTINLSANDAKEFAKYRKIRTTFLAEQKQQEQQLQSIELVYDFLDKARDNKSKLLSGATENLYNELKEAKNMIENGIKYNNMNADSLREYIVGDDVNNLDEYYYGCNRVEGPDAMHGTHVSGIVAAMRNNSIGINGIANHVKIMPVRAVPNGDERDKDIANAIRYAVDNGATVINMSFGKYYSPDKKVVDEAVLYALSKDVLLIHAAGNDSRNSDDEHTFPSRELLSGTVAPNWIEVGASAYKKGKNLIAPFSNYGKLKVDLFAPGVDIYSTIPDNKYINESGTSMAAPAVAGVAALIRSYFPELKAEEVKAVLMKTVVTYKRKVIKPGTRKEKVKVQELCISGGFINANNAVIELMGLNKRK